jgi:hypothetical protein
MYTRKLLCTLSIAALTLLSSFMFQQTDNTLTTDEKKAGWELLFDGKTTKEWKTYKDKPGSWQVLNGELTCPFGAKDHADLITKDEYEDFELSIDWKVEKGANSGIIYHSKQTHNASYETGPEYQLIDDNGYADKLEDWQKSGADYAMYAPKKLAAKPQGEWNRTKIIFHKGHVEHWLNGEKVVEFTAWSPNWEKLKTEGKWKGYPDYGKFKEGHIVLQDHGGGISFKNIKIRELK